MIIVETIGHDVRRAELRLELVLKMDDSPTPEALSGSGPLRFKILHASPEERALLLAHGIQLEDVDLKWAELHHRKPARSVKRREGMRRTIRATVGATGEPLATAEAPATESTDQRCAA